MRCSLSRRVLEPLAMAWVAPCNIMALETGSIVISTAISTAPPAIPTKPDNTLVRKAVTMIAI
jgi:hypothetical protein